MNIETTVNLDNGTLYRLRHASASSGRSVAELISLTMKKTMQGGLSFQSNSGRIRYQEERPPQEWSCLHVVLFSREYEFFLDMRKFFKRSVSFLIVLSVELYLDQIILEFTKCPQDDDTIDNYQFNSYILIKETLKGAIYWRIYWGLPEKIETILPLPRSS